MRLRYRGCGLYASRSFFVLLCEFLSEVGRFGCKVIFPPFPLPFSPFSLLSLPLPPRVKSEMILPPQASLAAADLLFSTAVNSLNPRAASSKANTWEIADQLVGAS